MRRKFLARKETLLKKTRTHVYTTNRPTGLFPCIRFFLPCVYRDRLAFILLGALMDSSDMYRTVLHVGGGDEH